MIRQEIQRFAERHVRRLHNHVNTEVLQLLDNTNLNRRLKRIKPFELCSDNIYQKFTISYCTTACHKPLH
jgi:hypothetical protein